MSRLKKLREIAAKRAPGKWRQTGNRIDDGEHCQVCECRGWVPGQRRELNAEFITTAANTYDLLLDVVEAAIRMRHGLSVRYLSADNFDAALAALEADHAED